MPRVHPLSVLVGLALATLCLFTMSQGTMTAVPAGWVIDYGPQPRDMRQVVEGTPFVVPPGKVFAITGIGTDIASDPNTYAKLYVDGRFTLASPRSAAAHIPSMTAVPEGLSAPAGSTVTVVDTAIGPAFRAQAWGYLADAVAPTFHQARVGYVAQPREMVQIRGGTPFVVPPGKLFVPTALACVSDSPGGTLQLRLDGELVCSATNTNGVTQAPFNEIPVGFTAMPGATLEVIPPSQELQAWGYLADQ